MHKQRTNFKPDIHETEGDISFIVYKQDIIENWNSQSKKWMKIEKAPKELIKKDWFSNEMWLF